MKKLSDLKVDLKGWETSASLRNATKHIMVMELKNYEKTFLPKKRKELNRELKDLTRGLRTRKKLLNKIKRELNEANNKVKDLKQRIKRYEPELRQWTKRHFSQAITPKE